MSPSMQSGQDDYLRLLYPHPPPVRNSTTNTTITIMSHVGIRLDLPLWIEL
jgi:hypothetical protein